jgi:hypothetical protein
MTRLLAPAGLAAIVVTVCGAAAPAAQATWTPNYQCNPPGGGFGIISYGGKWAESFPAKSSGKLLKADLEQVAREGGGTGGDINVELYGTNGSGVPVAPVLASTVIAAANITADDHFHDYTVTFEPATAAYLTSGQSYALALSTADSKQDAWNFYEANPCTEGALFNGNPPSTEYGYDSGIRTYLAPPNDEFEHSYPLSGQDVTIEGSTAGATRQEPEEPDHYTTNPPDSNLWKGDHSVWYSWTAPNSGPTAIDTCTGQIDSILAVYTGSSLGGLTKVADNNNDPACATADIYGSKVSFEATEGTTYEIAVGDAGGAREAGFLLNVVGAPDTTPPDTQIDAGPTGTTTDHSPSFTFSSEPGASFECRLDAEPFAACTSPKSYSSLPDGLHTFEVRAIDQAMNVDPTPASRAFTEATPLKSPPGSGGGGSGGNGGGKPGPPDTTIAKAKISQAKDKATFRFTSSEQGSFLCKLDGRPFRACTSPKSYKHLRAGRHRFQVEAVSTGGTDPSPASKSFRIAP